MRIAIRADASPQIGLGHIKRCLSLAQALIDAGAEVRLVSRDLGVDLQGFLHARGVDRPVMLPRPVHKRGAAVDDVAHADWAGVPWRTDADETIAALRGWSANWIVVDHYAFDARWHRAVGQCLDASIAVIDDLGDRELDAAVLVDHNYSADHRSKYGDRLASAAAILAGPRFALLSPMYSKARGYEFNESVRSIGIFMGGFDAADLTSVVLRACREQSRFAGPVEIATTHLNPNLSALAELCKQWPGTSLTMDADELCGFFRRHDLQIGAGGGATWERCCVGAPSLTLPCSRNQQVVIFALAELGILRATEPPGDVSPERIGHAVIALLEDPEGRRQISTRSRGLVDGLGARRVALFLTADGITLRHAQLGDAELIHAWRNHPLTRRVSRNSAEIAWPAHQAWLVSLLADPRRTLMIGTVGSLPVGVVRLDTASDVDVEVSLYLDPAMHGLGLGSALLREGEAHARQRWSGIRRFVAHVLRGNTGSQRMFESAGYSQAGEECWVKALTDR